MSVRIELRKDAGRFDRHGSPWVRRKQIARVLGPADPASIATLVDHRGAVLGHGLYSPDSGISLRLLSTEERAPEPDWLSRRLSAALDARARLGLSAHDGSAATTGYREVNSEGDGLPGLVVDRFGSCRVVQITTAPMAVRVEEILSALTTLTTSSAPETTVVLASNAAAEREGFSLEARVIGPTPEHLRWREHGLELRAPAPPAQKTGAYHDQRDNRRRFASLIPEGATVLDLGCHIGGFALAAARAGAARVIAVDQSREVLEHVRANAAANGLAERITTVAADMFGTLDQPELAGPFAAIVFDPPKIAATRRDVGRAVGAMTRTLSQLLPRLTPAGVLAACSCSHHLGVSELDRALLEAATRSGRRCTRIAVWGPGSDHPVQPGHIEGEYLRVAVHQLR